MSITLENPKIDVQKIQDAANAAAEKAYLKEIEDYYTGYSSPFRKMIEENLKEQKLNFAMELPNVLDKINSALKDEVDRIANNAIANSYIPMVSDALVGMKKQMKISDLLKAIIEELEPDSDEVDEFSFDYKKDDQWEWLNCTLSTPANFYEFTLHTVSGKSSTGKYQLLGFPYNKAKSGYNSKMTVIYKDEVKIEMPFTPNILEDKVLKLFFKMMIANSHITMDVNDFDEDWFPSDECHC